MKFAFYLFFRGLVFCGLTFGGKFVLVIRGGYIRRGLYSGFYGNFGHVFVFQSTLFPMLCCCCCFAIWSRVYIQKIGYRCITQLKVGIYTKLYPFALRGAQSTLTTVIALKTQKNQKDKKLQIFALTLFEPGGKIAPHFQKLL